MARIRSIKPEFFKSEDVASLPMRARLTWLGLWVHADNYGRAKDNPRLIKSDVWPLDPVSLADIEEDLDTLAAHGRIVRYEANGKAYLAVVNWDHQAIARPGRPKHPAPPPEVPGVARHDSDASVTCTDMSLGDRGQGTGIREGETHARDSDARPVDNSAHDPPPRNCPKHPNGTDDPCGSCKDARLAWENHRNQRAKQRALETANAPRCPRHRGQPAGNCAPCRAEQLAADREDRA